MHSPLPSSPSDQQPSSIVLWVAILGTVGTLIATLPTLISVLFFILTSFGKKQVSLSSNFSPKVLSIKRVPLELKDWKKVRNRTLINLIQYSFLFMTYSLLWLITIVVFIYILYLFLFLDEIIVYGL